MAFSSTRGLLGAAGLDGFVQGPLFTPVEYSGNGTTNAITGVGGQGDVLWTRALTNYNGQGIINKWMGLGNFMQFDSTSQKFSYSPTTTMDSDGFTLGGSNAWSNSSGTDYVGYSFQKVANMFEYRTYSGDGTSSQGITTGFLGTTPEFIVVTRYNANGEDWMVYHKDLNGGTNPEQYHLRLNTNAIESSGGTPWADTAPTSSTWYVGGPGETNSSGGQYIAYLFASSPGAVDVGSYAGTGATGNAVTTGFSPRLIIIKSRDSTSESNWYVWDSVRGNNSLFTLNNRLPEDISTVNNEIVPSGSGFTINGTRDGINRSGFNFIYIAFS